ncbi:hypothetical protein SCLCIDRAFT_385031 [Scleroderma citrinum Foug A]|uniref:Uncharacterized protein n=1 Tax=Scleroderma citrinum Foug A TaxID=1036808 RepID=A0A0C2YXI1_9AGAM|nr:hypothetical protein SCLCIDRAFT_385031 [Scleroderma citrinum Foug A]
MSGNCAESRRIARSEAGPLASTYEESGSGKVAGQSYCQVASGQKGQVVQFTDGISCQTCIFRGHASNRTYRVL